MAVLVPRTSGNFTDATTWGLVDSASVGVAANFAFGADVNTSNVDSPTFTPGANAVDALTLRIYHVNTSPVGTLTVTLRNSTTSTDALTVTVNIADLPRDISNAGRPCVSFYFGSSHTPNGSDSYIIRLVCSNNGMVTFFRNGTGVGFLLRRTTTQAPAAGDQLIITSDLTGAGTRNDIVVTMDETGTTRYGFAAEEDIDSGAGIGIYGFGWLKWGTVAATDYHFRWRGIIHISGGGKMSIGTSGTRMPADSTATFEGDPDGNNRTYIQVDSNGIFEIYGAEKKNYCRLTADNIATDTVITVEDTTGWRAGDRVVFTPTGTDYTHHEAQVIDTVDSGTQITLVTGLSHPHKGTGYVVAYILNMTRNVKYTGTSTSNRVYMRIPAGGGNVHFEYLELIAENLSRSSNSGDRAIDIQSTTNTAIFRYLSINPTTTGFGGNLTIFASSGTTCDNWEVTGMVSWAWKRYHFFIEQQTSGSNWIFQDNIAVFSDEVELYRLSDMGGRIKNNKVISCAQTGMTCFEEGRQNTNFVYNQSADNFDGNEAWYCQGTGIVIGNNNGDALQIFKAKNLKLVHNYQGGLYMPGAFKRVEIDTIDCMGNSNDTNGQHGGIIMRDSVLSFEIVNGTFSADNDFHQPVGVVFGPANGYFYKGVFRNCSFGVSAGSYRIGHGDYDIRLWETRWNDAQITLDNCLTASTTLFNSDWTSANQYDGGDHIDEGGSTLRFQRFNQTAGDHRVYTARGVLKSDAVIYRAVASSERLTPSQANFKMHSSPRRGTILSGEKAAISVWVRKSETADTGGADYNGNQPRLMLRANSSSLGLTALTVLDTGAAAVGTWEELTATIPAGTAADDGVFEVWVDCDGTAGWLNVDNWTLTRVP